MANLFFLMKQSVHPYVDGQVVATDNVLEFQHYVGMGFASQADRAAYEAAADARAALMVELPTQEEDAGAGGGGAHPRPKALDDLDSTTILDNELTVAQIKDLLDQRGIKYDKRWGKQRLEVLLEPQSAEWGRAV
jgi:hypothetical protein